jgi:iron(III) transport system ATP-binding protein
MRQVAVTGLQKAFGTHPVLTGVDLEVPAGSLTAILGPSGSGKTTLLRLMAGFDRADAGTIKIGDVLVDGPAVHIPPERRRIGYVPQEGSLFPHLTVAANVGFGLAARERRGGKVASMLEAVGLGGFGKRYPHQLSGGQQQRVALARRLASSEANGSSSWPGPWPSSRPWCCWTSRSPRWTLTCGLASVLTSRRSSAGLAPLRSW